MKLVGFIKEHNSVEESQTLNELVNGFNYDDDVKTEVIKYLNRGELIVSWMGYFFDLVTKEPITPDSYFTDGTWIWPGYLPHYLTKYNVKIDDLFIENIKKSNFNFSLPDAFFAKKGDLENKYLQVLGNEQ